MALASDRFTTYKVGLTLHVLAAVVSVGGALTLQLLALRATRSPDEAHQAGFAADVSVVGMRAYVPASLLLVLSGGYLVHSGHWGFGTAWVSVGLAVWLASFLSGAPFLGPQSARLSQDIATLGVSSPQAQGRLARIFLYSRIELAFLVLVVCDMVLKPGQ
jgi:uncharacterized membrane protein